MFITASIELTKCDIISTNLVVPLECIDYAVPSKCTESLSRSPQLWNSYSGYFRDSFSLCQVIKPGSLLNRQSMIVDEFNEVLSRFRDMADKQELANEDYYTQFNELFRAIYIHLNNSIDIMSLGLVDRVDHLLQSTLNSSISQYTNTLISSLKLLVDLNLLHLLIKWSLFGLYWLLTALFKFLKLFLRLFKYKRHSRPTKKLNYKRAHKNSKTSLKRYSSAPP